MENFLFPIASVVIPCRNEEKFIAQCLDSIIDNDYPEDKLEVLVIDGMSEDRTREVVKEYTKKHSFIKLLDNLAKITPIAFNIGIKYARGDLIMLMGAHSTYEKDYISKCTRYLQEYNADNVGGVWRIIPRNNSFLGKAIALVSSSPFGVGNAHYKINLSNKPRWVDTVYGGCYKRQVFEKIGLFNEKLVRNQDLELNLRLQKAGGRILLVPDIVAYYYIRSDLKSFCRYYFMNSFWATYPIKFLHYIPASRRHMIPLIFISSLIGSAILSIFSEVFFWLFLLILGLYLFTNFCFSFSIAFREKNIGYLFVVPILFDLIHVSFGLGSLWGFIKALGFFVDNVQ